MDKAHIIAEIRRTAEANGGAPLGMDRFLNETGIKESDWRGRYWSKWGDAVSDAGYLPNRRNAAFDENWVIEQLVRFIREIGRYPASGELCLKSRSCKGFPSMTVFKRIGLKQKLAEKVIAYCRSQGSLDEVVALCEPIASSEGSQHQPEEPDDVVDGYIYLIKSGRYYKVGRSNAVGRREYELAIQLPERATTVHVIRTDDPPGIEAYWHRRFQEKRKNGEWFALTNQDVAAFKRRKFM